MGKLCFWQARSKGEGAETARKLCVLNEISLVWTNPLAFCICFSFKHSVLIFGENKIIITDRTNGQSSENLAEVINLSFP